MVNADPAFVQELNSETSFLLARMPSHLRISNIRLTYNFPQQWMKICVQSAALSFSCDKCYTFASAYFAGMDPRMWAVGQHQDVYIWFLNVTF